MKSWPLRKKDVKCRLHCFSTVEISLICFQHKTVEDEGKSVVESFRELQRAKEQLQVDVLVAAERIEYLETKCERRKMKAIHKIQGLKYEVKSLVFVVSLLSSLLYIDFIVVIVVNPFPPQRLSLDK